MAKKQSSAGVAAAQPPPKSQNPQKENSLDSKKVQTVAATPALNAPSETQQSSPAIEIHQAPTLLSRLFSLAEGIVLLAVLYWAANSAYHIRTHAIRTYGRYIHEFDPWFNYRATEYLHRHGLSDFFKWYDHESWYPIGRPVGTTIYPGLQITAVFIFKVLRLPLWRSIGLNPAMSLNDICVFMPCWFGAAATVITAFMTRELSGSWRAGVFAACVMAIVPAHLMRSVGGGFDNESIAMSAMLATFWLWLRALRSPGSWWIGIFSGLAYGYMVAAWGGFIFVCNLVALHAATLVLFGYYTPSLHKAFTLHFIVGTVIAVNIPVVGWSPFRSLEQVSALLVVVGLQFIAVAEWQLARRGLSWSNNRCKVIGFYMSHIISLGAVAVIPLAYLLQTGYFGPLSVRVRSLFLKHTKTGNPLVDSVAEHQEGTSEAYWHYLHFAYYLSPVGAGLLFLQGFFAEGSFGPRVNRWFGILFGLVAYYFATRMSRLIILMGPIASCLAGVVLGALATFTLDQFAALYGAAFLPARPVATATAAAPIDSSKSAAAKRKAASFSWLTWASGYTKLATNFAVSVYSSRLGVLVRVAVAVAGVYIVVSRAPEFWSYSQDFAPGMSNPHIMFKAKLNNGKEVMIKDYLEAYYWIRDNTPKDARVLSWWDYGYQIAGIANRTTLADGNTWNLEHIAFIGRILCSPEERAWKIARHVADYVLVWTGGGGDDLAKSPHMSRIGSSVYGDICPGDPLCTTFGFIAQGVPTKTMGRSMLYKMHSNGLRPGVNVNPKLFREVHSSKYGLVRVYQILNISQESKLWAADPANRKCDAPGSWYCVGQYPPAVKPPPKTHRNLDYDDPHRYREEQ